MAWFAIIKAKVVLNAVLPFSWSEASLFFEWGSALGSINFCVGRFRACNFTDLGVVTTSWVSCGITWVGEDAPILVEFLGFLD